MTAAGHIHILILTGGGRNAGLGHVRRSATLARALRRAGADVTVCVDGDRDAAAAIAGSAPIVIDVSGDRGRVVQVAREAIADLAIVDAKDVPPDKLRALRAAAGRLGVIDDVGDRAAEADLIINGTVYAQELPYRRRAGTTLLLGPQYALLREPFAFDPRRDYPLRVRRILITVGGADQIHLTPRLIAWTRAACPDTEIAAVVGPFFPGLDRVLEAEPDDLLVDPQDIHKQMLAADLAISGGGQTTYELAATATPTIGILMGEDQGRNLEALSKRGVLVYVGGAHDPDLGPRLQDVLRQLAPSPEEREYMGGSGRTLVDGKGADRVAAAIVRGS